MGAVVNLQVFIDTVFLSTLFWWGIGLSVVTVIVFLPAAAWVLLKLPPDFLQREQISLLDRLREEGWFWRIALILKNTLGGLFLIAGFIMLFIPGQGLLAMLAGLVLLDFPGKQELERRIIRQKTVLATINWLRRRYNRPMLIVQDEREQASDSN